MKKLLSVLLFLSLSVSFVMANGQNEKTDNQDRMEITFAWFDYQDLTNDPVYSYICEKFNVDLKIQQIAWGDRKEQMNLAFASGDFADFMLWEDFTRSELLNFAENGLLRPFPSLDKYPNLKAMWNKMQPYAEEEYSIDGVQYAWPKFNGSNPFGGWWAHSVYYRADWAKELGMYKEQYTFDDMTELAKAIAEKDPGNNGAGATVGLMGDTWTLDNFVRAYTDNTRPYYKKNGKYVWGARDPEFLKGIMTLKDAYDSGAYYQDFYVQKGGDAEQMFQSGLVGVHMGNGAPKSYEKQMNNWVENNPELDWFESVELMDLIWPDGQRRTDAAQAYWSASVLNPFISDEKVDKILQIVDYLASPEGMKTVFYGVPGEHWEDVDGKVEVKWDIDEDGNIVDPKWPSRNFLAMAQLADGLIYEDPTKPADMIDVIKNNYQNLEQANIRPLDIYLNTFSGEKWLKNSGVVSSEQDELIKMMIPTMDKEEIKKTFSEFLDAWETRIDEILAELNS